MKIIIFSAFFRELKYILKHIDAPKKIKTGTCIMFQGTYSSHEIMAVQTGMGTRNAEHAVMDSLKKFVPDIMVSAGFGGALYTDAAIGDLVCAERCFMLSGNSVDTLENSYSGSLNNMSSSSGIFKGDVITLSRWMRKSGVLERIPQEIKFPVCDMETFPVARISMDRNIPFFAFRSVTDRIDEDIPDEFSSLTDGSGRYRFSEIIKTIARRPGIVKDMIRLERSSYRASKRIWYAVGSLLEVLPDEN